MRKLSFDGVKDHVRLWAQLKNEYVELRGETEGRNHKAIPKTTNADVLQLATLWTRDLERANEGRGYAGARQRWQGALDEIAKLTASREPSALYAGNQRFWDETQRLAIWLESIKWLPSRWDLVAESVEETVGTTAQAVAGGARAVAAGAGDVLGRIGKPVLLGAGALAALLLLPPIVRAGRDR